jgi:hypothetical protein
MAILSPGLFPSDQSAGYYPPAPSKAMLPVFSTDPNSKITPQLLLALGSGLLSGNTWNEQIANAGMGANTAVVAQQKKQIADATKNKTVAMLQTASPELAQAVAAGTMTPNDAFTAYLKQKEEAKAAAKPTFVQLDDGSYGWTHPDTQKVDIQGTAAKPKEPPASVAEYIWARDNQGFQGTLEDYQKNKISLKNQKGTEGNLKGDLETMKAYRGEDPIKTYQVVHSAYQKARSAAQLGTSAGDMSLIYAFMKMNDPTSVVREGEFATAANTGGLDDKIINIYNRVRDGQMLTPDQRQQFLQAADAQYQDASKNVQDVNSRYQPFAEDYNVNTNRFMIQPEQFKPLNIGEVHQTTDQNGNPVTIQRLK